MLKTGSVYILTNRKKTVLYIGVTSDLNQRMLKHTNGSHFGFARKYGCEYLIYYENFDSILDSIDREKQLKGWTRKKKEALIKTKNPNWNFLNTELGQNSRHSELSVAE